MTTRIASLVLLVFLVSTSAAQAQSFELGANFVASQWSEFNGVDYGVGGRLTWKPAPVVGIEAEMSWYPTEFPGEGITFTGDRIEGLVAFTAGPQLGRLRPFARAGAGFLRATGAPAPFPCIAIFPPPIACTLAEGTTMPTVELGGGLEVSTSAKTFLRFDGSWRFLGYPGPTMTRDFEVKEDGFWRGAFKYTLGGGWRF